MSTLDCPTGEDLCLLPVSLGMNQHTIRPTSVHDSDVGLFVTRWFAHTHTPEIHKVTKVKWQVNTFLIVCYNGK